MTPLLNHEGSSRSWTLLSLVLAALICLLVSVLHVHQRRMLQEIVDQLENVRQSRVELSQGFLHLSLSTEPDSPFSRGAGLALLRQAAASFRHSLAVLGVVDRRVEQAFTEDLEAFLRLLSRYENASGDSPAPALRIAFSRLERKAAELDHAARAQLLSTSSRLERDFALAMAGSLVLLAGLIAVVALAGRSRDIHQQAARKQTERLARVVGSTSDGFWDWDLAGGEVFCSPGWHQLLGLEEGWRGTPTEGYRHLDEEERQQALALNAACRENLCEGYSVEYRRRDLQGGARHILERGRALERDSQGRATRMVGVLVDISELRRAEDALRESEAQFRAMFEVASVGIVQADPRSGRLLRFNERFREITGRPEGELREMTFSALTHPDDREADWRLFCLAAKGEIPSFQNEKRYLRPDGGVVWVRINAAFIRDGAGEPQRTVAVCEDITERKQTEEEWEKLQTHLHQAQKMEAVGRLAGGVAHDFNNMLGIILGHADLALEQVPAGDPLREDLLDIRKAAERSTALTRQLLAFARRQTISPVVLDVNATVESILKMLRRLIGEDIELGWLPGEGVWPVMADPSQVDQILANLCVNARDAIEGTGKVTIESANVVFDDEYCACHPHTPLGEYVMIAVSDDGCGMDAETQFRLFEPFFTTKELGKGTGLGLATVYGIIKQNNGFIHVYSEPGAGTTFRLYLPRHADASQPVRREVINTTPTGGSETVLVVEDDATLLRMTALMLERQGYRVHTAGSPAEAVLVAHELGEALSLLVTDVVMPGMNGRQLAREMIAGLPDLRVLYMSGYTANVIAHHGVLDEGVRFLQKPFSARDLAEAVRAALDA